MAGDFSIVGIGASAGGVEALEQFFRAVPADNGMAFAVVTHLSPDHESMLPEILSRATTMPVVQASDGQSVEAEHVYVLPANAILTIRDGRLRLRRTGPDNHERAPIDLFFTSLAQDQAEHAIGIVLSGGGSDGTRGLKAIKENGGLTVAQGANATRPRFAEMPSSAVAGGFVDLLLPVEEIPARILAYVHNWGDFDPQRPSAGLAGIYDLVRARTGHDFSEYKDRTFQRRVQRRMQLVQTTKIGDYLERLQEEPQEVGALLRDLLIGVTDFFRDAAAFGALEGLVIPKLFAGRGPADEVRIWVAGCATGEEAYSIAMLLREHMDRLEEPPRVQIFATDIDEAALGVARAARYPATLVKGVSAERLKRFFVAEAGSYALAKEVRDLCIFSAHSVIRDPPFSRLDLVSCRNLLIYLKPALQAQMIPMFHYALQPGGYLFLGLSENVARHNDLFASLDRKNRLFRRRNLIVQPHVPLRQFLPRGGASALAARSQPARADLLRQVANTIVEHFGPTYVIVDETGEALYFSHGTGRYLQAAAGPATRDVVAMARPGLRADLRAALYQAKETGRRVTRERVAVQIEGGVQTISVTVDPIAEGGEIAYGVVFADLGPAGAQAEARAEEPEGEAVAVQQVEKELRETRERLQSTVEELETANEEFRSTNEELLSVNEELQSTNEELETSKEELQSTNEELHIVNTELGHKIEEVERINSDLNNLFESTRIATIFLDRNLVIRSFTPAVTTIFNLIPGDRGRPLSDIVNRIAYPELESDMAAVLGGGATIERAVSFAGGKSHYLARVLPYRHRNGAMDGVVLTFMDVSGLVAAEAQQKVLTAELSHRVKNTLAVVSSIAERTLPDGATKSDLIARFHALGHTQDLLSQSGWIEASLRDLILAELAPHSTGDGIAIGGPPIMLKPQAALFMTLVVHELSTNAAKYGALSTPDGRIEIAWGISGDGPRHLVLTWQEIGGPAINELTKRGFGTELIERGIRFELQGEAKLEVVDRGLYCRIIIPSNAEYFTIPAAPKDNRMEDAAS